MPISPAPPAPKKVVIKKSARDFDNLYNEVLTSEYGPGIEDEERFFKKLGYFEPKTEKSTKEYENRIVETQRMDWYVSVNGGPWIYFCSEYSKTVSGKFLHIGGPKHNKFLPIDVKKLTKSILNIIVQLDHFLRKVNLSTPQKI